MPSPTPNGAVFLSYASQDAAAARRLSDALRAAGIEVWFDQSELRGGDAWDQKIRRQIKDCALFIPVVSANTQSRREGYFRLEWKLAEDRTHLMAKGTPFLVPVCIDETKDWDALVPDSFMTVQWTRAPGGETPPKFVERVTHLLAGGTAPPMGTPPMGTGRPRPVEGRTSAASPDQPSPAATTGRRFPSAAWLGSVVLLVALLVAALVWPRRGGSERQAATGKRPPAESPAAAAFPRDPDLKRAHQLIYSLNAIAEDFALAEDIVKPLFAARPNDPEVVTVYADVAQEYLTRGFDMSDARRALVQKLTERAVQLAPDNPDALAALGRYLVYLGSQLARAEEVTRRAIAINPDESRYYRTLLGIVSRSKSAAELDELQARMAARFPRDPLVAYDIARRYKDQDNLAPAEEWFDKTLALAPISSAMVWKAWFLLEVHGDVEGMKAMLDRVPERERMTTRVVYAFAVHAGITGQTATAHRLLDALADTWLTDFDFTGPKALLLGDLLRVEGRDELAKLQYESAIAEIQRAEVRDPTDLRPHRADLWTQLALGHRDEARAALRLTVQGMQRPLRWNMQLSWWSGAIRAALLLDERAQALALLQEAVAEPAGRLLLRNLFHVDPRMAPWREDKEITALLAEPKEDKAASNKPPSEATKLAARAVALYTKLNYTREDLAVADELTRKATELEPDSAAAWGARAGVQATYLYRNWDTSEKRRQETQTFVNRSLGLNPDEPEALLALGHLLTRQGVVPQAEAALRRALAARPEENRIARALALLLSTTGRREEERVLLRGVLKRNPRDPLVHYDLAMSYANYGVGATMSADVATAIAELDAGIAAQPVGSLLVLKAVLASGWQGNLATMRATLDQLEKLPLAERAEDRAVFVAMWGGLLEHNADRVLEAATLTAKNYLEDTVVPRRPKDWSLALAHRLAGKENLARFDWQHAERVSRARLRDDPNNQFTVMEIACTLAWLGRADEAAREVAPIEAAWREELTAPRARMLAHYYAALGDAAKIAPYLQKAIDTSAFFTRKTLPLDPWFDQLRGQPEFEAVLQEPALKK